MEGVGGAGEVERGGTNSKTQVLRDRFRLNAISIAEAEGSILSFTAFPSVYLTAKNINAKGTRTCWQRRRRFSSFTSDFFF